jgi:hypothetical protein
MTAVASWNEVAAYLLTLEQSKENPSMCAGEALAGLMRSEKEELRNRLKKYAASGNQAARHLCRSDGDTWTRETLPIRSLRVSGGRDKTQYHELWKRYGGNIEQIYNAIREMREEGAAMDESVRKFVPGKTIPAFFQTIIVFRDTTGGPALIGDGYHRAVIALWNGEDMIECYVACATA